jgi:hypothetical protein
MDPTSAPRAAFAMAVEMNVRTGAQAEHVRKLFDRSADYGDDLVEKINAGKTTLARLGLRRAQTLAQRLRRSFEKLAESDFLSRPGEATGRRSPRRPGGAPARAVFGRRAPRLEKARAPPRRREVPQPPLGYARPSLDRRLAAPG